METEYTYTYSHTTADKQILQKLRGVYGSTDAWRQDLVEATVCNSRELEAGAAQRPVLLRGTTLFAPDKYNYFIQVFDTC